MEGQPYLSFVLSTVISGFLHLLFIQSPCQVKLVFGNRASQILPIAEILTELKLDFSFPRPRQIFQWINILLKEVDMAKIQTKLEILDNC